MYNFVVLSCTFSTKDGIAMPKSIEQLIPIDRLSLTLDAVAKATGINLCVLDVLGNVVVYPRNDAPFCACARQDPALRSRCLTAAGHAAFESARKRGLHVYKCFFGLVDFAVPLFIQGDYVGAICGGSARASLPEEAFDYTYGHLAIEDFPELKKIYDAMPVIEADQFLSSAKLMLKLAKYIEHLEFFAELESETIGKGNNLNKLHPALKYIERHFASPLRIDLLAKLCTLTPTYFSRLFTKTMGMPLSQYILNLRIAKAKELLQNKGIKIQSVAQAVGYDDPAYFVRKFKQATGVTPTEYQTMHTPS